MADSLRGVLLDSLGRPINSALVKVYLAGTSTLAPLYSDKALSVVTLNDGVTSPLSKADGSFGPYYVANGRYDIKPSKSGYTFDNTEFADLEVEDVREQAMTITAAHIFSGQPNFSPGAVQAPFILGLNAQGQRVIGLTADKLWDGAAARAASVTPGANIVPVSDASGHLTSWNRSICASTGLGIAITSGTYYMDLWGDVGPVSAGSLANVEQMMPLAGSISGLVAQLYVNTLTGTTVVTLVKNGVATALTTTITAGSVAIFGDSTNTVTFVGGDKLAWQIVVSGTGNGVNMRISAIVTV